MAGTTEPCTPRTYRVGPYRAFVYRLVGALSIGAGAWLPISKAASWGTTPLPPPPVQQVPTQGGAWQTSPTQSGRLQPGEIIALQVIPYQE